MELLNGYVMVRHRYHEWRYSLDVAHKAALAFVFACMVGLLAQIRIPLGFTPVPLTGQTFGVLLAGVALGAWWGGASMLMYVGIGALGMPWFQHANGGLEYVAGATGGYLVSFILVAFAVGWLTERHTAARKFAALLPVMLLSSIFVLLVGSAWLAVTLGITYDEAIVLGFMPFVGVEAIKAVAAAGIGASITTKNPYGPEM